MRSEVVRKDIVVWRRLWEARSALCRRNEGSRHVVYWRSHMGGREWYMGIWSSHPSAALRGSEIGVRVQDGRRLWAVCNLPRRRNRGSREYWRAHISSGMRKSGRVRVVHGEDRVGRVTVVRGEDRALSWLSANIQGTVD